MTVLDVLTSVYGPIAAVIARFLGSVCVLASSECNGPARYTCKYCDQPFCAHHQQDAACDTCKEEVYVCGVCSPNRVTRCGQLGCGTHTLSFCLIHTALPLCARETRYCRAHGPLEFIRCDACDIEYAVQHYQQWTPRPRERHDYGHDDRTCKATHKCQSRKRSREQTDGPEQRVSHGSRPHQP